MNTNFEILAGLLSNKDALIKDVHANQKYLTDATEHRGIPDVIVMAESSEDVIATIKFCKENDLSITARGAGTGLSGGCVPLAGGVLLSTENINFLKVNPKTKTAVCGPGTLTKELDDEARKFDLTYPPDPASYAESTMGGNVAENAGGLRCLKYGVTRDYVLGMKAVTAEGEILLSGCYSNNQGFNFNDILIGSEGTLAIITELCLKLIDLPKTGNTFLISFDNPSNAAKTVADIRGGGLIPTVMEYLDGDAALCSNQYEKSEGLEALNDSAALLLIETSHKHRQKESDLISSIANKNGATFIRSESDKQKSDELWRVRRNLSKAVKAISKIRISEDVVVPNSKFTELIKFVSELNSRYKIRINAFGHAGDGNLHVNYMSETGSDEEIAEIERGIKELMKKTIELSGSLSGEHGIGIEKRKFLPLEFDKNTLSAMKFLKETFDFSNRLNPKKIFLNLQ